MKSAIEKRYLNGIGVKIATYCTVDIVLTWVLQNVVKSVKMLIVIGVLSTTCANAHPVEIIFATSVSPNTIVKTKSISSRILPPLGSTCQKLH